MFLTYLCAEWSFVERYILNTPYIIRAIPTNETMNAPLNAGLIRNMNENSTHSMASVRNHPHPGTLMRCNSKASPMAQNERNMIQNPTM